MFNFLHPKSAVSSRPVAVQVIKQSAQAPTLPTVLVLADKSAAVSTPPGVVAEAEAEDREPER